ncbi:MAG: DoxX family protein [Rhodothermus sp.]|nr:DoxX family protein [Rhodothermus sp.]
MEGVFWVGRILFGGYFVLSGLNHLLQLNQMASYAATKKVPAPKLAVIVTGLMLLAGGLSVLTGLYVQLGLWLLVIFLVVVTPWMHNFWTVQDSMQRMGEQVNFFKNVGLLGATLLLLYLWS